MSVLIDRLSSLEGGANGDIGLSDSSLGGGVSGRISDCDVRCGVIVMLRIRDTAIVASALISWTRHGDLVFVANTTKYGIELQRENDLGLGSVTCDEHHQFHP